VIRVGIAWDLEGPEKVPRSSAPSPLLHHLAPALQFNMDSQNTGPGPVTIAQAVAAATQAQQQVASPPVQQPPQQPTSAVDNLTCQWQSCGERCETAEALYVSDPDS
jgi:hypothetical protein